MPLPFAPKPDESKVYQSLKEKLLTEITADQFDSLKETVYAQGVDGAEDEYRRLLLLGLASDQISSSGPIPGTGEVVEVTGLTAGATTTLKAPDTGEVYVIGGMSGAITSGSGTVNFRFRIDDDTSGGVVYVSDFNGTAGAVPINEPSTFSPLYIDSNLTFKVETSVASGTPTYSAGATIVRVR